jgi:hypothetical protein
VKDSFRADDPIYALIAEILAVVPVSAWQFARFTDGLIGDRLLAYPESEQPEQSLAKLLEEFRLQRRQTPKGPRLSAMLVPLAAPYVAGVTLLFADMRREFGILTLERSAQLGPFTSFEIQAFAFALDASIDRLSGFTVIPSMAPNRPVRVFARPAMHVLDLDLNVVLTFAAPFAKSAVLSEIPTEPCQRLPNVIATVVAELTADWTDDMASMVAGTAQPLSFLTVRTQPLSGPAGTFVGVLLGTGALRQRVRRRGASLWALATGTRNVRDAVTRRGDQGNRGSHEHRPSNGTRSHQEHARQNGSSQPVGHDRKALAPSRLGWPRFRRHGVYAA